MKKITANIHFFVKINSDKFQNEVDVDFPDPRSDHEAETGRNHGPVRPSSYLDHIHQHQMSNFPQSGAVPRNSTNEPRHLASSLAEFRL